MVKIDRKSNIEALRLLSMLMVLNLHSFWGYGQPVSVLNSIDFFRESTSICAVNVFLLISGYFGIKWKFNSFFNLTFQILFYSFGVYFVALELGIFKFTYSDLIQCFKCMYASWGFITGYILLYFCSPILNSFSDKVTNKEFLFFICIIYIAEILICRDHGFLNYAIMYLIGRFIRKTDSVQNLQINAGKAYIICSFLIFLVVYTLYVLGVDTAEEMCKNIIGYSYESPFVILQAIFLFLFFARINLKSKVINWCAESCLSIFLIHMHPSIKEIGYYSFTEKLYEYPFYMHIIVLIFFIAGVFICSILIDKVRILISNIILNYIYYLKSRIKQDHIQIDNYIPLIIKKIL